MWRNWNGFLANSAADRSSGGHRPGFSQLAKAHDLGRAYSFFDPIIVGEVLSVMEELVRHGETTMVIVTHEVPFAMKVAHRIVLMDQGRIVEEGTREEIFLQPKSWVGARYRELLVKESYGGYCQTWKNMA